MLVKLKGILKEKRHGKFTKVFLFPSWKRPGSQGTCNREETGLPGLPVSWSPTLFSVSGSVGLLPVPGLEKILKFRYFSSDAEDIAPAETWLDGQTYDFF
jgi:hypothetical protein